MHYVTTAAYATTAAYVTARPKERPTAATLSSFALAFPRPLDSTRRHAPLSPFPLYAMTTILLLQLVSFVGHYGRASGRVLQEWSVYHLDPTSHDTHAHGCASSQVHRSWVGLAMGRVLPVEQ